MKNRNIVRGALLIALALVLQSLRLFIPLPLPVSTFLIGSLVHMMLVLTLKLSGRTTAILLGILLPLTAYAQGQLALTFLIPVVWLGNILFIVGNFIFAGRKFMELFLPPLCKGVVMLVAAWLVLWFLELANPALRNTIIFAMSVPQVLTGIIGTVLARTFENRLQKV